MEDDIIKKGSKEANEIYFIDVDMLQCECYNPFLQSVRRFLNKNGYITRKQYEKAKQAEYISIHD